MDLKERDNLVYVINELQNFFEDEDKPKIKDSTTNEAMKEWIADAVTYLEPNDTITEKCFKIITGLGHDDLAGVKIIKETMLANRRVLEDGKSVHSKTSESKNKKEEKKSVKTSKKEPAKKQTVKEKALKNTSENKKEGVFDIIINTIQKQGPIKKEKILSILKKKFPERNEEAMARSISWLISQIKKDDKYKFIIEKTEKGFIIKNKK